MSATKLPSQGDLSETPLPRLLLDLSTTGFSGELRLERDRTSKTIRFQKGSPVASESNVAAEQLGEMLLQAGRISQNDHKRVSSYIDDKQCKEGAALLALELLDPKELFQALRDQVQMRIVSCFAWPNGCFATTADATANDEVQPFRCDVHMLVQDGLAMHWGPERLFEDLSPALAQYAQPAPAFTALSRKQGFGEVVDALVAKLDGSLTLSQAMGAQGNEPATLAAAWLLSQSGLLRLSAEPLAKDSDAEAAPAAPEIEIAVTGAPEKKGPRRSEPAAPTDAQNAKRAQQGQELRAEIVQKLTKLSELEHYAVLDVDSDAEGAAIKRAYLTAAKRYHPDALARLDLNEMKEQASEVFARIAEAYEVLSDPEKRRQYDDFLLDDGPEIDAAVLAQAETFYRKGEILIGMGDFRGALEYLQNAVDVWPEENAYQSALGWAFYKKNPSEPEKARKHLEKALELDSEDSVCHFRLGLVMRALGDAGEAD